MTGLPGDFNSPDALPTQDAAAARVSVSRGRSMVVHLVLVASALGIVAKAVQVQLVDASQWTEQAVSQQVRDREIEPPRGRILDANENILAESRELVKLAFTPRNIGPYRPIGAKKNSPKQDGRAAVRRGLRSLGVHDSLIRKVLDTTRAWVELRQTFLPSDVKRLDGLPGITRTTILKRYLSAPAGLQPLIGTVNEETGPVGGLELEADSLLRGVSGRQTLVADGRGKRIESPAFTSVAAREGNTISLTINQSLQELAERKLADGVARTGATGGDVVILDPRDGAVLAMAGIRDRKPASGATGLSEPYEPGSVMKPFVVSRALDLDRVKPDEMINTEGGTWTIAKRTVTDEHKASMMSMRDVIRVSSNIGAIKIGLRLSEQEEFEAMRDFGFGTLTGLPYPAESRGVLPVPKWQAQTASSIAMGYAVMATPLQVAAAYAAIANGGELLQPALIRDVRSPEGTLLFSHRRTVIRRAMDSSTAALMRTVLTSVVDSGTAMAAGLEGFDVAGKSGTAKRAVGGRYPDGAYNSTFAGMFPAQSPQYVLVVRLIDPEGKVFGGTVAGRVVNETIQGALATRDASLDRRALATVAKPLPAPKAKPLSPKAVMAAIRDTLRFDSLRAPAPAPVAPLAAPSRVIVSLPFKVKGSANGTLDESDRAGTRAELREVPSVFGLNARQAALSLHAAGFHVSLATGNAGRTRPAAGTLVRVGSVVVLETPK